tara:strand:+ start:6170 stop:6757 length:588 start_codon:yes stop_codon:yes gene_type:complete
MTTPAAKGMEDIIRKLNNAQENAEHVKQERAKGNVVVREDAQEMFNILSKLEQATAEASKTVVAEAKTDPVVATGAIKEDSVSMGDYKVTMEKQSVVKGISKKFYHIDCNGERLYSDIALFESAMIVVMKLIEDKDVDKILELDNMYCGALQEAAHYKMKSKKVNESFKFDLAQAKQQSAVTRMTKIKNQIKSLF